MPGFPGTLANRINSGPVLGVHNKVVQLDGSGSSPATIAVSSGPGSNVYVAVGFASFGDLATPTDTKSNTYAQRGTDQVYAGGLWPGFGIRAHSAAGSGGTSHTLSTTKGTAVAEFSQVFIEVLKATTIAVTQGSSAATGLGIGYSSPSATVSGPAILLSCWTGDGDVSTTDQSVSPGAGWAMIEYAFIAQTAYVQFAVAYRSVSAGTYSHTWTPAVNQGAAMMMLAVT